MGLQISCSVCAEMSQKGVYGKIRKFLGPVFHELASQRRSQILEGHRVQDHVPMLLRIPPKYPVAEVIG
jgi:putative transposase